MTIKEKAWKRYLEQLRKVNDKATESILYYLQEFGMPESPEAMDDLIYAAWNISTKYGEAAAELAAEMYDSMADLSGVYVPPALPAPTPTRDEVAHAILGTVDTGTKETVAAAVGRQVKMTGVDTTMRNALRDGAEWAWIPTGRTCAFCLTLASRGWQRASKKAIKNGHAEHIHANCDCTYAVRFDGKSTVAGYDPEKLKAEYDAHNGDISDWQRDLDAPRREEINARKRELYAEKKTNKYKDVTAEYIQSAKPGKGKIIYEAGYNDGGDHNAEVLAAYLIHRTFGGDIILLKEANQDHVKTADFMWNGHLWDLKEPTTAKAANSAVRHGLQQIIGNPGGIILNYKNQDIALDSIIEVIEKRMKWNKETPVDIMIIKKENIEAVLRYNK